jgi:tRNA 2-thiouridine synthesizing protein A
MQDWGRASDNPEEHRIDSVALASGLRAARELARTLGMVVDNEEAFRNRLRGPRGRKTDLCGCAYESLAVFSDGEVYPCVWLAGAPDWASGKATGGRLAETFRNSPQLERLRRLSVASRDVCASCEYRFLCGGGNPCASYFESLATKGRGDVDAKEPFCAPYMDLTESLLDELSRGTGGGDENGGPSGAFSPRLVAAMEREGAACSHPHTENVHRGFEVATARCACVLRADAEGELARLEALGTKPESESAANAKEPNEKDVFDARGRSCVDLLLPLAAHVRTMSPGQEIDVLSDDPAASVDLPSWCRMTGNELVSAGRAAAHAIFRIKRGGVAPPRSAAGVARTEWDAGDMGCGELVIELKLRLDALPPGTVFDLVCDDPGAEEDIPAFCRMTGHALLSRHSAEGGRPVFRIRRRATPRA